MASSPTLSLLLLTFSLLSLSLSSSAFPLSRHNFSAAIHLPSPNFNSAATSSSSSDCNFHQPGPTHLKLHLKHRPLHHPSSPSLSHSLSLAAQKDFSRLLSLSRQNPPPPPDHQETSTLITTTTTATNSSSNFSSGSHLLVATLESGVSLGSGEYFIDVFVGTPPAHFSLILDTGSDLNWLQCLPCHDCFPQRGPHFDPSSSSSFKHVPCSDPRCALVSPPPGANPTNCSYGHGHDPCPYYYWYGDRSNTTGDLAVETFTVNLTGSSRSHRVDDVIFGCGHWNRGLFHGAAGLLGLGRGPLSFASQLRRLYGHTFSYCLVDRNSDLSVTSKLIFGEDDSLQRNPSSLNYTSFLKSGPADTFYYVQVAGVLIGGEKLDVPGGAWDLNGDGSGGTIVDSGTTLSYFADPVYRKIREGFLKKVKYPVIEDFPVLSPCYNVTGVEEVEMPGFSIVFADGAVWDFPAENYFIRLEPERIMCLAILGTPVGSMSIIGNYQQQNFHVSYDMKRSRLGFAPMRCAEI